ncbi:MULTISPECIES: hypothetical protein [Phaeobacter]|uniref:COG3904 family protein n=1 Tax=Phaeobacter TaxID=302485 RepID=UPI00237FB558|nr:hypothetical protein [Phaeobacter gallaeciensis]MDE4190278.1 hypothetical protein [Phaeobacter gallaeciensis]MDE4198229.1 hypothetical protein [Phaeobacter gallaeciensis]MDE4202372.1 hypothetical protein [Phaeobacter gallaeciensis]MDE4206329.1 hypothetical protein [Phaeobacter gallaeciensis]MDE4214697.1 hypothetical protein [Phaeobacter gallaeciensis]
MNRSSLPIFSLLCLVLLALPLPLLAREPLPQKFRIDGEALVFDTETDITGAASEIIPEDIDAFRSILADNPQVTEIRLNSGGGSVYAGAEIAWIVMDHGLNTSVDGECVSACVDIFLAGQRRRMMLGSKIGFHQRSWAPEAVQSYYREWRDDEDWATPFEFGSWIYQDTQEEIYEQLTYLVSRGVDPAFAIETMRVRPNAEWYPSRLRLVAAGVLREQAPQDQ